MDLVEGVKDEAPEREETADEWHARVTAEHEAGMRRFWAAVEADLRRRTLSGRLRYWLTGFY